MQQPSHHYDSATTVFSPEGRIYQVEYAREVVKRGTTVVAVTSEDAVGFLAGRRKGSPLALQDSVEKIFEIDDHVACASCGLVADARRLVDIGRHIAAGSKFLYDEPVGVEGLVRDLSNRIHGYTQTGGNRPFGVALLVGGLANGKPRVFETDPSGAFVGYKAAALGNRADKVRGRLEERFTPEQSLDEALAVAYGALTATPEETRSERYEGAIITQDGFRRLSEDEIQEIAETSGSPAPEEGDDEAGEDEPVEEGVE